MMDAGLDADSPIDALARLLVERDRCDPRAIDRARRAADQNGGRLDRILLQLGLVSERDMALSYAEFLDMPLASADLYPREPVLTQYLGARFLRDIHAVPLGVDDGTVTLALRDPLDGFAASSIAAATGLRVSCRVAVPIELEAALDRLYPSGGDDGVQPDEDTAPLEDDAERLKDLASEAPVIRLVNQIVSRAVETHASDIHIEPFEDRLRVRYRYDGVLHEVESPPAHLIPAIISRIKIMARLDIAERRLPQDGRIKLAVRGHDIDFRVSTIPSLHGETVVLRVLDRSSVRFDYATLGLPPAIVARLRGLLALPNGIVLVTGPTGSGKTTTLYTGLADLNAVTRKVVTIEDPIEYQLGGINQVQVRPQIGLTFAALLRAILRQDPDVIMVGEIRDIETAQIAVQAALTGHLVLSTLHTNSAAAAIIRLRDMGVEDYLLTAVLRGVVAQRLVRRLCGQCRTPYTPPRELVDRFDLETLAGGGPVTLFHPVGCAACRNTGYSGRQAIAELLEPDEAVERLIFARSDHLAIERAAVEAGMVPMFTSGLVAALKGETTIEEVTRSVRAGT
ncbi:type II secretion system protein E [Gluconacetobacter diazotrophicus PA1 5]|uniref:Putative type II secretion pathway kinase GspE n=1 Tax=Gluconacetobacter diazotrophicus (strain ATCC 49037 / DSM 5601 / CCUG 37298 / CIP 103539 / LMG 7603 / PAl5) TaxID=272568 RepID=A9H678_GLUDA|nr:type II secretion system protein E [Gluconacetobacter diazotrophicus PA1 5]TWB09853.1 type II secretion system protein E (GspE) [Gluconacetobacter diazotrophicus]CAP54424.1 putative type II secretion pathway kinase GspE [Gluconacetobacter diazotrophicus PA1 5]